jgi:serpin B
MIDPLLGPNAVTSATVMVLVNAVYFNAGWLTAFDKSATQTGTFTRADGLTVQTPMMNSSSTATAYATGSNWQAVELPYSGGTTSLVAILPDAGAYSALEQSVTGAFYQSVTSALSASGNINLTMPSFKIHGPTVSLKAELQALGMTDAFDATVANFTGITSTEPIWIGDVLHQAFVDVDESGTVAAAATAVVTLGAAVSMPSVNITLDHPFFFFIRDIATNTILFAGREGDPTAQ